MVPDEPEDSHERAWTLPAAAGLAALEVTVTIAVLAVKYPICWMVLRRQAWAFLSLLLWEFTVGFTAVIAPGVPLALRGVELAFAASVIALLFASAHLFPRAQLPRR